MTEEKRFLSRNTTHVFVMLGSGCNFNCKYCLQQNTIKEIKLPTKLNEDVPAFIVDAANSNQPEQPLVVQFYGGEPLLYFDKIKKIVERTKQTKNILYRTITNGSLMTDEMVDFFNEHHTHISVSWDGRNTSKVRDKDVFSDPVLKERLFKIKSLGTSSVVSAYAYPKELLHDLQLLTNEYCEVNDTKQGLMLGIDQLFDTGVADRSLFDIDYQRIFDDMTDICTRYYNELTNVPTENDVPWLTNTERNYIQQLISIVKENTQIGSYTLKHSVCYCGNGYHIHNVDLAGNLYVCHNVNEKIATIYDPYFYYLEKVIEHDCTKEYHKTCKDCPVLSLCNNGCKLISPEVRKETYCDLKLSMFGPVINMLVQLFNNPDSENQDTSQATTE